ncbi:MAG: hypothetical protein HYU41_12105 [Candidatus Rokubacteria bacterium]|nr:hypothetical protein [Candidatus Rokubacteria bacterium]
MRGEGYVRALALAAVVAAASVSLTGVGNAKIPDRTNEDAPAALPGSVARDCDSGIVPAADVESTVKRVIGQVVGLDDQAGKITLNTRAGQIAFAASADTMAELDVGDVIVIELTPEPDTLTRANCQ